MRLDSTQAGAPSFEPRGGRLVVPLPAFWLRLRSGIEVAVAGSLPDKTLGVRDGFLRYFHDGLLQPVPVAVVPQPDPEDNSPIPASDAETLALARRKAHCLAERLGSTYVFYAASEAGVHTVEEGGETLYFVRNWTVLTGAAGEACGGSGSVQIPSSLIAGLDRAQIPIAIPGTRRRGGMMSSLTGGLETRRSSVAVSTLLAISTLLYGFLESRPVRRRL
jgi:non-canonical (house-cleaning) NTP pyrophosphatase